MWWLRRVLASLPFLFVLLLPCSPICVPAGHAPALFVVSQGTHHNTDHAPCHSPRQRSGQCADCHGHVFLRSGPPEAAAVAASDLSPRALFLLPLHYLFAPPISFCVSPLMRKHSGFSIPSYLSLSVLRL